MTAHALSPVPGRARPFARLHATVLLVLSLFAGPSAAQTATAPVAKASPGQAAAAADATKVAPAPERDIGPKAFKALKYRSLGPAWGGRVSRVVGVPGDPFTYYFGAASSGVWKSVDSGVTWRSIFDEQITPSVGSIAVAPSDPNVVYVGSGEANIRGNVVEGIGVFKSVDAGKTWTHVLEQRGQIGTMVVHPRNADIAFAAMLGRPFGPNSERGVYRTRDGGRRWDLVLRKDADTGASDVALDPSNPNIVFAGLWQARRTPWDLTSGGPGSGLYMSRDGGDTWRQLSESGLPGGVWGKVGVAVAPSDGRRVYALIEADAGGLFRSDNGGDSWTRVSADRALRQRAWYYSTMTINPSNPDDVWFPQVPMLRTIDGGKSLTYVSGFHHGDHHDVWIDPRDPKRMIDGNDGGVDISTDGGATWTSPPLPLGQFYHVSVDTRVPYRIAGAMQDIGTAQGPSDTLRSRGIPPSEWYDVGGGEAGHVVSDAADPDVVYAGEYLGIITRYDHRTRQSRNVSAWPENPSGLGGVDMRYRFQWTAPIAASPFDPKVVYHGAQVIFRTADGGLRWDVISPDLTRNDKTKQNWSGGPITGDNTGVETYGTVFAIAESPKQRNLIWAGSDDGLVHVTVDGGKNWRNVTAAMPGFPEWGTVSLIEPSPFDAETSYVVVDAHRLGDLRPYLYKTTNLGKTWVRLDGKLPQHIYLHAVREDPARAGLLYLGTDVGVMFSTDAGAAWQSLQLNLPTVPVHDLLIKENDLVLATHGRSIWILDDVTPIRLMSPDIGKSDLHLFPVPPVTAWRYGSGTRAAGSGANPARGASIAYYLRDKPAGEVSLELLDERGAVIRTLSSTLKPLDGSSDGEAFDQERKPDVPSEAGVQQAIWDLRYEGAAKIRSGKIDTGDPSEGPRVLPGTYTARLRVGSGSRTTPIVVAADPRVTTSLEDQQAQLAFALAVRDDITRLTGLVDRLRAISQQLKERNEMLKSNTAAAELVKTSTALIVKAAALEAKIHNPGAEVVYDILAMKGGARLYSRLSPLLMWATEGDGAPTQGMKDVYAEQKKELDRYDAEVSALVGSDLAAINQLAARLGIAYVVTPTTGRR